MATTGNNIFGDLTLNTLGLGGQLADQVAGETEEERKRRLAALRANTFGVANDPASPGRRAVSALGLSMGY